MRGEEKKGGLKEIKEKSVGALHTEKMTRGGRGGRGGRERARFIFHPDILGTWTQSCRPLH